MHSRKLTDAESWMILILFLAFLFGGIVRFAPAALSDFPINDGGMFYLMTGEVQSNHYRLPATTAYNGLQIPFAYPPLGFYLAGFISDLLHVNLLDIFLWLPAVLSTLSLIAFFFLARVMLDSALKGALATLFFALLPRSFSWFLMGGGVTRALGQLFLVLTVYCVFMTLARRSRRHLWFSMLFGGLACMSHPEAIIHAGATCLLLVFFHVRSRRGIFDALMIAFGVLLVSSPWWLTVLLRFGPDPFLAVSQAGGHNAFFWLEFLRPVFAEEKFVTLITVLGLIGLGVELFSRRFFLPIWLIFPFLVEPRSASAIAIFPLALLAAIATSDIVLASFTINRKNSLGDQGETGSWIELGGSKTAVRVALGYMAVVALIGSFSYSLGLSNYRLSKDDRAAMIWVSQNTPQDSRFILITGNANLFSDPVQEWFPVLSNRVSQSTIQGLEWVGGEIFSRRQAELLDLQACANREADCLSAWVSDTSLIFDYVYIERYKVIAAQVETLPEVPALLLSALRNSPEYELVYESDSVLIFVRR